MPKHNTRTLTGDLGSQPSFPLSVTVQLNCCSSQESSCPARHLPLLPVPTSGPSGSPQPTLSLRAPLSLWKDTCAWNSHQNIQSTPLTPRLGLQNCWRVPQTIVTCSPGSDVFTALRVGGHHPGPGHTHHFLFVLSSTRVPSSPSHFHLVPTQSILGPAARVIIFIGKYQSIPA